MPHSRTDNSSLGVLLMSVAAFLWVLHDAISKWLMQDYSIYQVLLLRTIFSLLPILIVLRHEGGTVRLRNARVWVCLGRGCLAVVCFVLSLTVALLKQGKQHRLAIHLPLKKRCEQLGKCV